MKTILVVDDLASVRFYHQSLLRQAGFEALAARDGIEALALLEQKPVDLVLLDLVMPKMGGAAFLQRIRSVPRQASLPVLVITSEGGSPQVRELQASPHVGVLTKPILPQALLAEVRRFLG